MRIVTGDSRPRNSSQPRCPHCDGQHAGRAHHDRDLRKCDVCRALMRDGERIFEFDPLVLSLGQELDTRLSLRIAARAHARWLISHLEHDVIELAVIEYQQCGEALRRIGKPR